MKTINPAKNYVFAKKVEIDTKTSSGFLLSTANTIAPPQLAVVINSSAEGYERSDMIMYKTYTENAIELDKESFIVLHEEDILGTVQEVDSVAAKKDLAEIKELLAIKI